MPGQQEGHLDRLAGLQVGREGDRAEVGLARGGRLAGVLVGDPAVGDQVVPVDEGAVPGPVGVGDGAVGAVGAVFPGGGEGQAAVGQLVRLVARGGHFQPAQAVLVDPLIKITSEIPRPQPAGGLLPVGAEQVEQGKGEGGADRLAAVVAQAVAQHGHRQAGIIRLAGNQRVEGVQGDLHREGRVVHLDAGKGVDAGEGGALQPGQAGAGRGRQPVAGGEGRQQPPLGNAQHRLAALLPRPDHPPGKGGLKTLGGPVEQLPVAQLPATAQGDGPGPDPAQREGDLMQGRTAETAGLAGVEQVREREGHGKPPRKRAERLLNDR